MNTGGATSGNNPSNKYEVTDLNVNQTAGTKGDPNTAAKFEGKAKINGREVTVILSYGAGIDETTAKKDMHKTMLKVAYLMDKAGLGKVYTEAVFSGSEIQLKSAGKQEKLKDSVVNKEVKKIVKDMRKEIKTDIKGLKRSVRKQEREVRKLRNEEDKLQNKYNLKKNNTVDSTLKQVRTERENKEKALESTKAELESKRERQLGLKGYTTTFLEATTTPVLPEQSGRNLPPQVPTRPSVRPPITDKETPPTSNEAPKGKQPQPSIPTKPLPSLPQGATPQRTPESKTQPPPISARPISSRSQTGQGSAEFGPRDLKRAQGKAPPNTPLPATPQTPESKTQPPPISARPISSRSQTGQGSADVGPRDLKRAQGKAPPNTPLPATPQRTPESKTQPPPISARPQGGPSIQQQQPPPRPSGPPPAVPQRGPNIQQQKPPPRPSSPPPAVPQRGQNIQQQQPPPRPQTQKTPQQSPFRPQRSQDSHAQFGPHDLKETLKTPSPSMEAPAPASTPFKPAPTAQTITSFDRSKKFSEHFLPPVIGDDVDPKHFLPPVIGDNFNSENFIADDLPSDKTKVLNIAREILTTEKVFAKNMSKTIKGLEALEAELKKQGKELSPSFLKYKEALTAILEASNKFTEKLETMHQADGKIHLSSLVDTMNSPELHVILSHIGKASTAYEAGVLTEVSKLTSGTTPKDKQVLKAVNNAIENDPGGLGGLVIQPIQRGPRYQLLAEDLSKAIEKNKEGSNVMGRAIETIKGGITSYNEAIRRKQSFDELRLLQRANLKGGLPIWDGTKYQRVTTKNIKPDDFIKTLEHLTSETEIGGYIKARSPQELEAFKDLPKVFNAFKGLSETKFKKGLSEEQEVKINNLTKKLETLSDGIVNKDVSAVQYQVSQKLKVLERIPRDSQADLSKLKESFEELEKWGESINSQTNNPKIKEMINKEFATKRGEISQKFQDYFNKRAKELSVQVDKLGEKVNATLLKEIQEFREFATEASASGYIPSQLLLSSAYSRFDKLSSGQ